MVKIGITGGIGSGKTTVCRVFEQLGIPVFYADAEAKWAMINDADLISGVKKQFGEDSYFADGRLNNKHIASIVFNNEIELEKLNSLVHPAVFRLFDLWVNNQVKPVPYVLKEAALLFESGSYQQCDKNILVSSPLALRIARVMERDQVSEDQVRARIDKQFSDERKKKMADYFIENDEHQSVILQVMALHEEFLNL